MDMRKLINIVEGDPAVGTIPASGATPMTASAKPTPPAKGSAARKQEQDAAQDQSALPGGKADPNAVELDKDNGLDKGTLDAIKKAGVAINIKETDINFRDDEILKDILASNQEAWNNFREGNDITDNDDFYQQLVDHFISTEQLSQEDVDKGIAVERITKWLDTLANNVEVVEMDDNDYEKYGDEADRDDMKATDSDRKNADKNIIMQIRRAADNDKKTTLFVNDGETVVDKALARKLNYAFDNIPAQAKGKFQRMLMTKAGLDDIIKMVDDKNIPEATSTAESRMGYSDADETGKGSEIDNALRRMVHDMGKDIRDIEPGTLDQMRYKIAKQMGLVENEDVSKRGSLNEGTMVNDVDSDAFVDFLKTPHLDVGPDPFEGSDGEEYDEEKMVSLMKLGAEDKVGAFFFDDELWDNLHVLRKEQGEKANAMPLIKNRVKELFIDESAAPKKTAKDLASEIRAKELELQKLYKKATVKDLEGAKDLMKRTKSLDRINIGESATAEDVADAIKHRMLVSGKMVDALEMGKGPEEIMFAINDVAEWHEGAEELGSSDISIMVKEVMNQLGVQEAYVDDNHLDTIYESATVKPKLTYEDITRELEEGQVVDMDMAHEIMLVGDNDAELYQRQYLPIIKNLMRKRAKGVYEPEKAVKLWRYWVDNVVKKHAKDLGVRTSIQISGATRNEVAKQKEEQERTEMELGNWDNNKSAGTAKESVEQVNEAEMYKSLEDVYPAGPTEIWYWKSDNGRDFMMGMKWLAKRGVEVTKASLADTHVKIGTIAETDPERIYMMMQGENWSPEGEARDMIKKSGTGHTSMSVGDVLVIGGKLQMVDRFGFVNPEDKKEVEMSEGNHYSPDLIAAVITDRIFEETKNAK